MKNNDECHYKQLVIEIDKLKKEKKELTYKYKRSNMFLNLIANVDGTVSTSVLIQKHSDVHKDHNKYLSELQQKVDSLTDEKNKLHKKFETKIYYGEKSIKILDQLQNVLIKAFLILIIPYWVFMFKYSIKVGMSAESAVIGHMILIPITILFLIFQISKITIVKLVVISSIAFILIFSFFSAIIEDNQWHIKQLNQDLSRNSINESSIEYHKSKINRIYIPIVINIINLVGYIFIAVLLVLKKIGIRARVLIEEYE